MLILFKNINCFLMKKNYTILILILFYFTRTNAQLPSNEWAYIPIKKSGNDPLHNIVDQVIDKSGNIYTIGSISGAPADMNPSNTSEDTSYSSLGSNTYFSKIDKNGKLEFINYIVSAKSSFSLINPKQILLDKNDNIVLFLDFMGRIDVNPNQDSSILKSFRPTYEDMAIVKYNNSGNYIWGFNIESSSITGSTYKFANINSENDIIINGYVLGNIDLDPSSNNVNVNGLGQCLIAYDENGNYIRHTLSSYNNKYALDGKTLTTDSNDNNYYCAKGNEAAVVFKTNEQGNIEWSSVMGSNSWPYVNRCDIDAMYAYPNGDLLIMGSFIGLIDFDLTSNIDTIRSSSEFTNDYFIVKLKNDGSVFWKKIFTNQLTYGKSYIDANNIFHLVGTIKNNVIVDNLTLGSNEQFTSFYSKIDENGKFTFIENLTQGCVFNGINSNDNNSYCVFGKVTGNNIDIDPSINQKLLSSPSFSNSFTAVYGKSNHTKIDLVENYNDFIVYPNPSNGVFSIKSKNQEKISNISVHDITGKKVEFDFENEDSININKTGIFVLQFFINNLAYSYLVNIR